MTEQTEHNKKRLLSALEASLGVVTTACRQANLSRTQYYEWLKDDEEFASAVKDIVEVAVDFAETQLHKQIMDGSTGATIFYLKTKGKHRGYVETQEFEVNTKKPLSWLNEE